MPRTNITLYTLDGEVVTEFELSKVTRKAPFKLWSISRCMELEELKKVMWPKGVEAEVMLVLIFHSHHTLRTTEIASIVSRDVATVCRALHALKEQGWVLHVSRGTWKIYQGLIYHGRWRWVTKHGK